jgi:hypothetical protein
MLTQAYTIKTMPGAVAAAFAASLHVLDRTSPRHDGKLRAMSFAIAFEGDCACEETFDEYLENLDAAYESAMARAGLVD